MTHKSVAAQLDDSEGTVFRYVYIQDIYSNVCNSEAKQINKCKRIYLKET